MFSNSKGKQSLKYCRNRWASQKLSQKSLMAIGENDRVLVTGRFTEKLMKSKPGLPPKLGL